MQSNNNQFPNNPNFPHSNLPSLTNPTTQHSTRPNPPHPSHPHPSHPHQHQHPHPHPHHSPQQQQQQQQQQVQHQTQFTFNNNPPHTQQIPLSLPTITRSQSFGATPTTNNINAPHTSHTSHTSHQSHQSHIPTTTSHTNPVYTSTIPSNTQYLYQQVQQVQVQQAPLPQPHANNGNNTNNNNTSAVPYTISNIQDKGLLSLQNANHLNANRKRTRAGFENVRNTAIHTYQSPATKKQRLGDGTTANMPQIPHAIPPPLYNARNNTHNHTQSSSRPSINMNPMSTQKEWRQTRTTAKFKMAMDILDQFKQNHGGKLPSLRAVMKMLKVGFPKAHEILDAYAAHIGVTKEKLMQDMTVRQEKKRTNENNNKRRTRTTNTNTNVNTHSHSHNAHSNTQRHTNTRIISSNNITRSVGLALVNGAGNGDVPKDVNIKLQGEILEILQSTQSGDKRGCYLHCSKLEELVREYEEYYSRLSVNDRLRLAQSYFLLGSMYREKNSRNFAYSYVERALSTFRDCNGLALAAGYSTEVNKVQDKAEETVSQEDIGHFWPQIVEVYILGGHILLANAQYSDAKDMYELAHNLAVHIKTSSRKAQITVSEALENLAVVSMYDNKVDESIKYTKKILEILLNHNSRIVEGSEGSEGGVEEEKIPFIKILNARAYYSCCLTLSSAEKEKNEGYVEYNNVIRDAKKEFGEYDARTIGFYCYFGLHFVQIKDWKLSHQHIRHILNIDDHRNLENFEKNVINDLLTDYFKAIIALNCNSNCNIHLQQSQLYQSQLQMINDWLGNKAIFMHEKQLKYANEINNHHFEANDCKEKHNQNQNKNNNNNNNNNNSSHNNNNTNNNKMDTFKSYEFEQDNDPKVNIIEILINHIKIFIILNKFNIGYKIINDLIVNKSNNNNNSKEFVLNHKSNLLSQYLKYIQDIKKNEIDQLIALYHQIINKYVKQPPKPQTPPIQLQIQSNVNKQEIDPDINIQNNNQQ